ncbi:uncharacterized protein KY384_005193 [Bacidia gigantensis]|uniref:uncharacterized protein n=1 Tax=Bacidia gigantensis TaxID=2732470 RepID=UPI001D04A632|nr:uncharacterized protein KY384_005193 [Bacidia gigantensis]KAG8529712.1 hypothetical protein KY384_005193 [Bacidia gigantensis]
MASPMPLRSAATPAKHRPKEDVHVDEVARTISQRTSKVNRGPEKSSLHSSLPDGLLPQSSLRRANAKPHPTGLVTVNPAPKPRDTLDTMRGKGGIATKSAATTAPPDPNEFAFHALLSSLGPEADEALDKMAEICGNSKMSLANSHDAHLPPLGGDTILHHVHHEPEEIGDSGVQTRSVARRLERERAESTVLEERINVAQRKEQKHDINDETNKGLIAQVLGWLRGSKASTEPTGVENDLRSILRVEQGSCADG